MNRVEEQREIIDKLYQIVKGSTPASAESARCLFDYQRFEDGSSSVGQRFEYIESGKIVSAALDRSLRSPVMSLVKDLHYLMKSHTGGDWSEFSLAIDQDGRVTTKFEYPDDSATG